MSRTKLTDKQKKKIIADYMENGNYRETGRINNVSDNTVRNIVNKDQNTSEKLAQKKEENTKDILEYMDSIVKDQKEVIDLSLKVLKDKLSNPDLFTNVRDVATVYGVIFDKALKYKEMQLKEAEIKYRNTTSQETLDKLDALLEEQKNAYMD